MKRFLAVITFICFLSVTADEGNILIKCVPSGCRLVPRPASGIFRSSCCGKTGRVKMIYMAECEPVSYSMIAIKNVIDYKKPNSISACVSCLLKKPGMDAVLENNRNLTIESPLIEISVSRDRFEKAANLVCDNVNFNHIHPGISTTVLRL